MLGRNLGDEEKWRVHLVCVKVHCSDPVGVVVRILEKKEARAL